MQRSNDRYSSCVCAGAGFQGVVTGKLRYLEEADLPVERVDGELQAVAAAGVGRGRRRLGPGRRRRSHQNKSLGLLRDGRAATGRPPAGTQSRARPLAAGAWCLAGAEVNEWPAWRARDD
jgi:hypothetical protein